MAMTRANSQLLDSKCKLCLSEPFHISNLILFANLVRHRLFTRINKNEINFVVREWGS